MVFEETITIECFLAVWPLPSMVFRWFFLFFYHRFQWFSMVPDHWSNDAMVSMDRCGLEQPLKYVHVEFGKYPDRWDAMWVESTLDSPRHESATRARVPPRVQESNFPEAPSSWFNLRAQLSKPQTPDDPAVMNTEHCFLLRFENDFA